MTNQPRTASAAEPARSIERLLTPADVAAIFCVDPKTVSRWANSGKLQTVRTLGGHRRFSAEEVTRLAAPTVPQQRSADEPDVHVGPDHDWPSRPSVGTPARGA